MKQPLSTFVTRANYSESDALPVLAGVVEVHEDLDSVIFVFDKGYVNYGRFAGMKNDGVDFVTPLKDNAKHEVVERVHDFEHEQLDGEEVRVIDECTELRTTGREYRKVTIVGDASIVEGCSDTVFGCCPSSTRDLRRRTSFRASRNSSGGT